MAGLPLPESLRDGAVVSILRSPERPPAKPLAGPAIKMGSVMRLPSSSLVKDSRSLPGARKHRKGFGPSTGIQTGPLQGWFDSCWHNVQRRVRAVLRGISQIRVGIRMPSRFPLRVPRRACLRVKEVIQLQVHLQLPCYDFTPVTAHSFGGSLTRLGHRLLEQTTSMV